MSLVGFLVLMLIAAVCGTLGQGLSGYTLGGWLMAAVVGFIGAYLGLWLGQQLGLPALFSITVYGETFPVFWSIIGSALFSAILGILTR